MFPERQFSTLEVKEVEPFRLEQALKYVYAPKIVVKVMYNDVVIRNYTFLEEDVDFLINAKVKFIQHADDGATVIAVELSE